MLLSVHLAVQWYLDIVIAVSDKGSIFDIKAVINRIEILFQMGSSFWGGFTKFNDSSCCFIFLADTPFYGSCIPMSQ